MDTSLLISSRWNLKSLHWFLFFPFPFSVVYLDSFAGAGMLPEWKCVLFWYSKLWSSASSDDYSLIFLFLSPFFSCARAHKCAWCFLRIVQAATYLAITLKCKWVTILLIKCLGAERRGFALGIWGWRPNQLLCFRRRANSSNISILPIMWEVVNYLTEPPFNILKFWKSTLLLVINLSCVTFSDSRAFAAAREAFMW